MSNPLLRPNDPRFQKPDLRDGEGKNRFGEPDDADQDANASGDIYAAGTADAARPFLPQYEVQQRSRGGLWLILGGLGWAAACIGGLSLGGVVSLGWICPLLGIAPSGAAWLFAYEELKTIRVGAIQASEAPRARHAFWLGLTGFAACLAVVGAMVYRQMAFLPDL